MSIPRPPLPHPNCYWIPGERILAGEYPGTPDPAATASRLELLLRAGVDSFIDLTESGELSPYEVVLRTVLGRSAEAVHYRRIPVRDLDVPGPATMREILDTIESEHAQGRTVYVHCWGGVGRTGTVVGCLLVRRGQTGEAALLHLEELWRGVEKRHRYPRSPETDEQRRFVREWREDSHAPAPRSSRLVQGCLLGGAVGDALGAPVEFMSLTEIRTRYGANGLQDLDHAYGRVGAITDDTQMALFTAEGLLRAVCRARRGKQCSVPRVVHHAYLRWLHTQGEPWNPARGELDGWLVRVRELHSQRAPGATCLAALRLWRPGSMDQPWNDSKGCGGIMRAAPAGLVGDNDPFRLGCEVAALTHGHPTGYLAAGCHSAMVADLINGATVLEAAEHAMGLLRGYARHQECVDALAAALQLYRAGKSGADQVERLGQGWVAEEALGIAVFSALAAADDFAAGVRLAVNHGGDSDSVGCIAGNLLGARLGLEAIPPAWLAQLELRPEIQQIADDLCALYSPDDAWLARYPDW
jgi:ADP-ribosylglycohydrolase